jgi:5-methylcytosine-specific restriction enzyme subunit McrC
MSNIIRVPEHGILKIGVEQGGAVFEKRHWTQLFKYHDEHAAHKYFDMRHDGVRFNSYVGVIQAGDLTIEILPKVDEVDDASDTTLHKWRDVLLRMLRESGMLRVESLSNALLREKENSLLDIYLALFLQEVEALLYRGLVKRYRHMEGQQLALRGAIQFGKHIARNLVHQERFYTRHQTYDHQHLHNQLIRQALLLLPRLTHSPALKGRTARALLQWAESPSIKVSAATFSRLSFDRKTEAYRPALVIARLLLLQYRPDLQGGTNDLIALLFNMNALWEQYLLRTLARLVPEATLVCKPSAKVLWQAVDGSSQTSKMEPDILVALPNGVRIVLDAKWKRPKNGQPAPGDIRQLYAYSQHYNANHAFLLYPHSASANPIKGAFCKLEHLPDVEQQPLVSCSTIFVQVGNSELSADAEIFDSDGYLRCSLNTHLRDWLLPSSFTDD